jgi:hypothetical protein
VINGMPDKLHLGPLDLGQTAVKLLSLLTPIHDGPIKVNIIILGIFRSLMSQKNYSKFIQRLISNHFWCK